MKTQNFQIIVLLVYSLVVVSVFYALTYSNLRDKYDFLLDDYSESKNEIVQLQWNYTQLSYYYNVLEEQYDSSQGEYNSLKTEYHSLKLNHTRLSERYSNLQEKYSNLKNELKSPPPPFKGDPGSSPDNAAEIGTRITCPFMFNDEPGYEVVIKVVSVISGVEAYKELELRGVHIPAPRYNHDYLLVKLQIEYIEAPEPIKFIEGFRVFSLNGDLYDPPLADSLEPYLGDITFHGDWRAEGWLTFEVPDTEATPLLSFAGGGSFTSGYWFKLFI